MGPFDKYTMGQDGFVWFIGVVEGRQDPLALGRVQVRAFVTHSASLTDIPSADLPWASVMQSTTAAPALVLKEADVVFGFFADGRSSQAPVIMGILPGFQINIPSPGVGFQDQRTTTTLQEAPRKPVSLTYTTDGSGVVVNDRSTAALYPIAPEIGKPTFSGATRYDIANTVIQARKTNLDANVLTATGLKWSEPYPAFNPLYPYNKAYESESGHLIEIDDTPGYERLTWTHRSGQFIDMYPTGSRVDKVTRSRYEVTMGDDFVHVMGRVLVTVGEGVYIKALGDVNVEADNDLNVNVSGDFNVAVKGDFNLKAANLNADIDQESTINSGGNQFITADGDVHVDATGTAFVTGEGQLELFSSGTIDIAGSDLNCQISATQATAGSGNDLAEPAAPATPNSGEAPSEDTPVPFTQNFANLDAFTGLAYKQSLFLTPTGDTPDAPANANSSNANTSTPMTNCGFDANVHTFLSSDTWTISTSGLQQLQTREGLAKILANGMVQAYPDPVTGGQPYTIGYGCTQSVLPDVTLTLQTVFTQPQCSQSCLDAINNIFLPKLQEYVTVDLTQNMVDSLISFMYNVGINNFASSTLRKDINAQLWCNAYADFKKWNKSGGQVVAGLTTRRNSEASQFVT